MYLLKKRLFSCFLLLCFFSFSNTYASDTLLIENNHDTYALTWDNLEILEDSSRKLSFEDRTLFKHRFKSISKKYPSNLVNSWDANYWLKLKIRAKNPLNKSWAIILEDRNMSYIEMYAIDKNGKWRVEKAGSQVSHDEITYSTQSRVFEIYPDTSVQEVYFKFHTLYSTTFPCYVATLPSLFESAQIDQMLQGLNIGFILLMIIYALFLFATLKEKLYLYYAFYLFAIVYRLAVLFSWGEQYIWTTLPAFTPFIAQFEKFIFLISLAAYSNAYNGTNKRSALLYYTIKYGSLAFLLFFIVRYAITGLAWVQPYSIYILLHVLIIISAALAVKDKVPNAGYFVIGILFIPFDYIIFLLNHYYIIPNSAYKYSFFFISILEVCFFSFALAKRIQFERMQRENALQLANQGLEERKHILKEKNLILQQMNSIKEEMLLLRENHDNGSPQAERTEELSRKNIDLKRKYDEMEQWNVKLDRQNWDLNRHVEDLHKQKVFGNKSDEEFDALFPDDYACMQFINDRKWKNGFVCLKCKNTKWSKGPLPYSRTCTKCSTVESVYKNTIHENSKLPVKKAFYIIYKTYYTAGSIPVNELAQALSLPEKSCRLYKNKVSDRMNSISKNKIKINGWNELIINQVDSNK